MKNASSNTTKAEIKNFIIDSNIYFEKTGSLVLKLLKNTCVIIVQQEMDIVTSSPLLL